MAKKKLFTAVPDNERKDSQILLRLTRADVEQIQLLARERQLSVSEFMRRAAFGLRTNVDMETEIILGLREVVGGIRALHKSLSEHGAVPQEVDLLAVIIDARMAMLRIV